MDKDKSVEFSLMGLAGLLAEHGFRVIAGNEGKNCWAERMAAGGMRHVFRVQDISLTVALETPEAAGAEPPATET